MSDRNELTAVASEKRLREGVEKRILTVRVKSDVQLVEVLFCDSCQGQHDDLRIRQLDGDSWYGHCPKTKKPLFIRIEEWVDAR